MKTVHIMISNSVLFVFFLIMPMNAYERRLVHIALRGNDAVDTHSEGSDPDRHVVIVAR